MQRRLFLKIMSPWYNRGVDLHDPKKLLTGTGKIHKHVELNKDVDLGALNNLLDCAYIAYLERKKESESLRLQFCKN